jgi:hypothetical protein
VRHRPDNNASILIQAAERLGMLVELTGRPTDALVGIRGKWVPVEFKAARGTYTPAQEAFRERCEAHNLPFVTWRSVEDVIAYSHGIPEREG